MQQLRRNLNPFVSNLNKLACQFKLTIGSQCSHVGQPHIGQHSLTLGLKFLAQPPGLVLRDRTIQMQLPGNDDFLRKGNAILLSKSVAAQLLKIDPRFRIRGQTCLNSPPTSRVDT